MLLKNYRLEIFNLVCNPGAIAVHCFAHLDQDVSWTLPGIRFSFLDQNILNNLPLPAAHVLPIKQGIFTRCVTFSV